MLIECPRCQHKVSKEYYFVCPDCGHRIKEPIPTQEEHANLRLEYKEINLWLRHMEIAWWAAGTVLVPSLVAVIYKTIGKMSFSASTLLADASALLFGSLPLVVALWIYTGFSKYIRQKELQFVERLKEIEVSLDIKFIQEADKRNETVSVSLTAFNSYNNIFINWIREFYNKKIPYNFTLCELVYILCIIATFLWFLIFLIFLYSPICRLFAIVFSVSH